MTPIEARSIPKAQASPTRGELGTSKIAQSSTSRRDHERIDVVLASRVAAEDDELGAHGRALSNRVLRPLYRLSSRRFLREARAKVWHNTIELQVARLAGRAAYDARLTELEVLSAARVADLLAPGQAMLRLAVAGFGVQLPPPPTGPA